MFSRSVYTFSSFSLFRVLLFCYCGGACYCCCHPVLCSSVSVFALLIACVTFVDFLHPPCFSPVHTIHRITHNVLPFYPLPSCFILSLSLARYSLRIRVMYAVGIYAFALCCVCWHAFIFERVSPCYRIRYSAIMCLSVAIRQQHCTLCESCTAHERRCYSELCVPLHSIHSQCLCIKYLCRRYDSVSLE